MEEWPTSSETTIIYLQNYHKTPTFAEPQQYNIHFSSGHVSAFINKPGKRYEIIKQ
jgi:hypothetical protein